MFPCPSARVTCVEVGCVVVQKGMAEMKGCWECLWDLGQLTGVVVILFFLPAAPRPDRRQPEACLAAGPGCLGPWDHHPGTRAAPTSHCRVHQLLSGRVV